MEDQGLDLKLFLDFSDLFRNFLGVRPLRRSQAPLGRLFFETFRGFGVLGSVDGRRDPKITLRSEIIMTPPPFSQPLLSLLIVGQEPEMGHEKFLDEEFGGRLG